MIMRWPFQIGTLAVGSLILAAGYPGSRPMEVDAMGVLESAQACWAVQAETPTHDDVTVGFDCSGRTVRQ